MKPIALVVPSNHIIHFELRVVCFGLFQFFSISFIDLTFFNVCQSFVMSAMSAIACHAVNFVYGTQKNICNFIFRLLFLFNVKSLIKTYNFTKWALCRQDCSFAIFPKCDIMYFRISINFFNTCIKASRRLKKKKTLQNTWRSASNNEIWKQIMN